MAEGTHRLKTTLTDFTEIPETCQKSGWQIRSKRGRSSGDVGSPLNGISGKIHYNHGKTLGIGSEREKRFQSGRGRAGQPRGEGEKAEAKGKGLKKKA